MQAVKLSWTEVGYRELSSSNAHAAAAHADAAHAAAAHATAAGGGKRQRLDDSNHGGRVLGPMSRARGYRRGLRLDGSQCLAILDGHVGHPVTAQPGASSSGGAGSAHGAEVANGVMAARRQVLAGVMLEPVSEDSDSGQEVGGASPAGVARRRDSTRWLMTLHSPYLAALEPGPAGLGRALHRVPDGVALEYSLTAGSHPPHANLSAAARPGTVSRRHARLPGRANSVAPPLVTMTAHWRSQETPS